MGRADTPKLATERLDLEPLSVSHAGEMVAVLSDPAVYHFMGGRPPTLDELVRRYQTQVVGPPEPNVTWHNWVLRLRGSGSAIGFVQATVEDDLAELAWVVAAESQGRGFASEAAAAMVGWLVSTGISLLTAHIHPEHTASGRVASSVGLTSTGEIDDEGEVIWSLDVGPTNGQSASP